MKIKIAETEHPFKFTTGAAKEFKEITGKNITGIDAEDFAHLHALVFCGVKWGYKAQRGEAPEDLGQQLDCMELSELAQHIAVVMEDISGGKK